MKILHCADLHIDSRMNTNFDAEKRKKRKAEILNTYRRMIEYAAEQGVAAILIAGDLFDTNSVSRTAMSAVYTSIIEHPDIAFYYLKGNHDVNSFLASMEEIPSNLHLFSDTWLSYEVGTTKRGRVMLSGVELNAENSSLIYPALSLDSRDLNIVTLHGQSAEYRSKDKTEVISMSLLKNKGIDYLALGHVHAHVVEALDARGIYCYPGCLEGRGFDECGEKGFVVLDIDEQQHRATTTFVPIAARTLYTLEVDVTGAMTTQEVAERMEQAIAETSYPSGSMVKFVLTGDVEVDSEFNCEYLQDLFTDYFYFEKVYDHTHLRVDYSDYEKDASLKGEFIRMVLSSDLSEDEKTQVIRCGIMALSGEEI